MSSMKTEWPLSPSLMESEVGVMCSATQCGFLVRRSKQEVVEAVGRRSDVGPGNPY